MMYFAERGFPMREFLRLKIGPVINPYHPSQQSGVSGTSLISASRTNEIEVSLEKPTNPR
jgi:hypothetical protein